MLAGHRGCQRKSIQRQVRETREHRINNFSFAPDAIELFLILFDEALILDRDALLAIGVIGNRDRCFLAIYEYCQFADLGVERDARNREPLPVAAHDQKRLATHRDAGRIAVIVADCQDGYTARSQRLLSCKRTRAGRYCAKQYQVGKFATNHRAIPI